ncbi:MAG: PilN domain-containing protein [Candidatus Acidiferrales bacterium]
MIRINLLGQARPKAAKQAVPVEATVRVLMLIGALAAAAIVLFVIYVGQNKELTQTKQKISELQAEKARLQQIRLQVQQFESEKQILQQRINVIEELQKGRTGGQELLTAVAGTVARTDGVWLTSLSKAGNTLTFEGEASSVNAVANFITQMKRSGYFDKIEIKEAKENDLEKSVQTFAFTMSAEIASAQTAPAAATPPAGAPAPAPKGRS